jgi:hypothetical protein
MGQVLIPGKGKRVFSSAQLPYRLWGPPNSYPMGLKGSFPRVNRLRCEAGHSEVKKSEDILPLLHTSSWRGAK